MTRLASGYAPRRVARADEMVNARVGFNFELAVERSPRKSGIMAGQGDDLFIGQRLGHRRHEIVLPHPTAIIVKLLVNGKSGLAGKMRILWVR